MSTAAGATPREARYSVAGASHCKRDSRRILLSTSGAVTRLVFRLGIVLLLGTKGPVQ